MYIKYPINASYFKYIDTAEKAYWLGFLYADGTVGLKTYNIKIALSYKDIDHLYKLREVIQPLKPIRVYELNNYKYAELTFTSKEMMNDLISHGCIPNKTFKLRFPEWLNSELVSHFIRGYFDGDGCITLWQSKGSPRILSAKWSIVSTLNMCKAVQKIFKKQLGISSGIDKRFKDRNDTNRNLNVNGRNHIHKVLNWIYDDANLYLVRKHQKYIEFLQTVELKASLRSVRRKFTDKQASAIREEYAKGGIFYRQLAKKYTVCLDTIRKLITNKQYK